MNDMKLYEKVPRDSSVRILQFKNSPVSFYLHWHEHVEIHFILDGKSTVLCGDKVLDVTKNQCVIFNTNELHEGLHGKADYLCVMLPPTFFENKYILFENKICDPEVTELMQKIYNEHNSPSDTKDLSIKGYTYLLISYLIEQHTAKNFTPARYRQHFEKVKRVNDTIKYIEHNYEKNISTASLADKLHISEGYFCHIFKEITGKNAKEYINIIRIEKAYDLLKTTNMTIVEISAYCGFADANYFARMFKKIKKCTPTEIRNQETTIFKKSKL